MKDYKDTLLMGKTNFEMRGNLGQKEPLIQEKWNQNHVYEKVLEKIKDYVNIHFMMDHHMLMEIFI